MNANSGASKKRKLNPQPTSDPLPSAQASASTAPSKKLKKKQSAVNVAKANEELEARRLLKASKKQARVRVPDLHLKAVQGEKKLSKEEKKAEKLEARRLKEARVEEDVSQENKELLQKLAKVEKEALNLESLIAQQPREETKLERKARRAAKKLVKLAQQAEEVVLEAETATPDEDVVDEVMPDTHTEKADISDGALQAFPEATERPTKTISASISMFAKTILNFPPTLVQPVAETVLSPQLQLNLSKAKIESLFAVQVGLIPLLLSKQVALYEPFNSDLQDFCVAAPTGSGKTLSYVLPIVQVLTSRIVTRIRALVILPTRDLVSQVHQTFQEMSKGTDLKITSFTGSKAFVAEQTSLNDTDIAICTPGRLMDHLQSDQPISLQHTRFMVMDEADRLLNQSFSGFLRVLHESLRPPVGGIQGTSVVAPSHLPPVFDKFYSKPETSVQQLLFSATLTNDPAQLASLNLRRPVFLTVSEDEGNLSQFSFPPTLKEHLITCKSEDKPLHLIHLLFNQRLTGVLCFTRSVESAQRLTQLLKLYGKATTDTELSIELFSSDLSSAERARMLSGFRSGRVTALICSDLIARGMDIPLVQHVISYDAPSDLTKYVHRVGRTARAGRHGDAWSILETQEVKYWKGIMHNRLSSFETIKVKTTKLDMLRECYEIALHNLAKVYQHI